MLTDASVPAIVLHTNRFCSAPSACVLLREACHASTTCSGERLSPSGFAMMDSTQLEKEKVEETPVVEAVGTATTKLVIAKAETASLMMDMIKNR